MTDELQTEMKHFCERLKKLSEELELMKKYGIHEDLLVAYLCHNLKISQKDAIKIIKCYEDFYGNFIKKGIAKSLD